MIKSDFQHTLKNCCCCCCCEVWVAGWSMAWNSAEPGCAVCSDWADWADWAAGLWLATLTAWKWSTIMLMFRLKANQWSSAMLGRMDMNHWPYVCLSSSFGSVGGGAAVPSALSTLWVMAEESARLRLIASSRSSCSLLAAFLLLSLLRGCGWGMSPVSSILLSLSVPSFSSSSSSSWTSSCTCTRGLGCTPCKYRKLKTCLHKIRKQSTCLTKNVLVRQELPMLVKLSKMI